eukprot:COSAG01_NODE_767_length_13740_cov_525.281651_2_plen_194_part_00
MCCWHRSTVGAPHSQLHSPMLQVSRAANHCCWGRHGKRRHSSPPAVPAPAAGTLAAAGRFSWRTVGRRYERPREGSAPRAPRARQGPAGGRTSRHAVVTRRNPTIRPAPPGRHPAAAVRGGGCGALWLHGGLALYQNSPAADRTVITCSSILVHRPCTAGRSPRTTHRSDAAQHSTAHVAHVLYRCTGRYNWW